MVSCWSVARGVSITHFVAHSTDSPPKLEWLLLEHAKSLQRVGGIDVQSLAELGHRLEEAQRSSDNRYYPRTSYSMRVHWVPLAADRWRARNMAC